MSVVNNYRPNIYNDKDETMSNQIYNSDVGSMPKDLIDNFDMLQEQCKVVKSNKVARRNYTFDFKTSNESFLQLYTDLKKLGIENCKFFLRIYNRDLIGINPFQSNLPYDTQLKIIIECIINPWYFLREVCRIPEDGCEIKPGGGVQYRIDRNNLATWYLLLNGIDVYKSKPRQTGKTQDTLAFINYAYHFGTQSTNISFFNKKTEDAQMNLARLKNQRDCLPAYMQMKILVTDDGQLEKETDNVRSFMNPVTRNKIQCMPRATSAEAGMGLGRGLTTAIQCFDECDFTPFIDHILNSSMFAFKTASDNAKRNGALTARIFTSTPGDLQFRTGKFMAEYTKKMLKWKDEYYDTPITKLRAILDNKNYLPIVYVEHTWKMLRKSLKWYEELCKLSGYAADVIAREIDLQRINSSANSPFNQADLYYVTTHKIDPIEEIDLTDFLAPILVYETLIKKYHYILSIDPSEGLSRDNIAMTLVNPYTLKVAAEFQCNYMSPPDFADMIIKFMDKFCPRSMIIVENNKGWELLRIFQKSKYHSQLYYDADKIGQKIVESSDKYGALRQAAADQRALGFNTSRSTRPLLYSIIEEWMISKKDLLYSKYVVEDIAGLVRGPTGKIEAGSEGHDDNIMSYLIALYIYYNATNLEEFGIFRGEVEPPRDGSETKEMIMNKINQLLGKLPEKYKGAFDQHKERDENKESWDYQKKLESERSKFLNSNPEFMDEEQRDNYTRDSEAIYRNMERQLISNDISNQPSNYGDSSSGGGNNFNMDDWV